MRDPRGDALKVLVEYDRRHRSQLLSTLEEYLKRRGNIAAAAQTLFVHPNTLRQRLRRIQDLTGLDVANEDWLMIEIELKLLRLEHALGRGQAPPVQLVEESDTRMRGIVLPLALTAGAYPALGSELVPGKDAGVRGVCGFLYSESEGPHVLNRSC